MRALSTTAAIVLAIFVAWAVRANYSQDPMFDPEDWVSLPSTQEFWPGLGDHAAKLLANQDIPAAALDREVWGAGRPVSLKAFAIMRHEVSCGEYAEFLASDAGAEIAPPAGWSSRTAPAGRENHPVTGVSLAEAEAYAAYRGARLPTEFEWEYATRGFAGMNFPWGNVFEPNMARISAAGPKAVDDGKTWRGLTHACGNVAEWTTSPFVAYEGGAAGGFDRSHVVVRGGSFADRWQDARLTSRRGVAPNARPNDVGIRLARTL